MKIAVCGKGGCGKSTVTSLLARACLKKAFCKMCVTICGNNFSDTLYWTKSVKYHYRPEVLCQNSKTTYNFI